jgi:hypothetical protein
MSAKPSNDPHSTACESMPSSGCWVEVTAFESLRSDVGLIKQAVVGNDMLGHRGLVRRQDQAEADIVHIQNAVTTIRNDISKTKERVLGIVSGAAFVGSGVGVIIGLVVQWVKM